MPTIQIRKLHIIIGLFITALVVVEIWVSHSVVTYGERYKEIEALQKTLENENQILENQIDKLSSLSLVASRSGSLGLKAPKEIQYIH